MAAGSEWEAGPGPGPGPEGGYLPPPRGGAVTTMGILNLVLGGIEILLCGWMMIGGAAIFGAVKGGEAKVEQVLEKEGVKRADIDKLREVTGASAGGFFSMIAGVLIVLSVIGLIVAGLRIWAGIGVLNRRSYGRTMTIVLASISIVFILFWLLAILTPLGILFFLIYLGYVIAAFVILLSARNAAEFRRV